MHTGMALSAHMSGTAEVRDSLVQPRCWDGVDYGHGVLEDGPKLHQVGLATGPSRSGQHPAAPSHLREEANERKRTNTLVHARELNDPLCSNNTVTGRLKLSEPK